MRGSRIFLFVAVGLCAAAGCRKPPAPPSDGRVDVGGRVEDAEGKPLSRLMVRFVAQDEENQNQSLICKVQADGKFIGKCPPGRYKVTLAALTPPPPAEKAAKEPPKPPPLPDNIPSAYGKTDTTPWQITVAPGGTTDLVLKVE